MINDKIEAIKAAVQEQLQQSGVVRDVQDVRVKYLGKKGNLRPL